MKLISEDIQLLIEAVSDNDTNSEYISRVIASPMIPDNLSKTEREAYIQHIMKTHPNISAIKQGQLLDSDMNNKIDNAITSDRKLSWVKNKAIEDEGNNKLHQGLRYSKGLIKHIKSSIEDHPVAGASLAAGAAGLAYGLHKYKMRKKVN